jgi:high-affinity Fe2+/Pb2+ permease
MTDILIAGLDFIGFLGFFMAFIFSYKNFQKTRNISPIWLMFAVSMVFLSLFAFLNSLEWLDIYPQVIDQIQNSLLPVSVVSLFMFVLVTHEGFMKPV